MTFKSKMLTGAMCLAILSANAQQKAPDNWFTLDPAKDNVLGTSADAAQEMLKALHQS